jgi:hypothetical protein
MSAVSRAIKAVNDKILSAIPEPTADEITIEFGVSATVEKNILVARGALQGNFKVSMTWKRKP